MAEQEKQNKSSGLRTLIILAICCMVIYFWVIFTFPQSITCKEGTPPTLCECIRSRINKNAPFFDKLKIRIVGASTEELNAYLTAQDVIICAASQIAK